MLKYGQLHEALTYATNRHDDLQKKFLEFARQVETQLTAQAFPIRGIAVTPAQGCPRFNVAFAGRDIRFVFSSRLGGASGMRGVVSCYIAQSIPEEKLVLVGEFSFDGRGKSDIIDPEENEGLHIDYDLSSIYIALHFINESLQK